MADVKISGLTAVSAVEANDLLEVSEDTGGGTYASRKATATQIKAFASADSVQKSGDTMTGPLVVNVSSASDALRITQTGTGNALVVEDSANPDSSPFVVDADGLVLSGFTTNQAANLATGNARVQINGGTAPLALYRNADSSTAINLEFAKRRATGGLVANGDVIGRLYFSGNDGTAAIPAAFIDAAVDGTPGASDMPGRLVFSTTADGASSPTERMRITSAGSVGIGSTANDYGRSWRLVARHDQNATTQFGVINGTVGISCVAQITKVTGTANSFLDWGLEDGNGSPLDTFAYGSAVLAARWNFNSSERMRITSAGNVGIGTSSPVARLDLGSIVHATPATGVTASFWNQAGNTFGLGVSAGQLNYIAGTTTANSHVWYSNSSERMRISSAGNVGIGTASPGAALDISSTNFLRYTRFGANSVFVYRRANGTEASPTTVASGESCLTRFDFYDGSSYVPGAQISAVVDGTPGTNDMPTRLGFFVTADGSSTLTEQMRLDNAGNLRFNSGYGSVATAYGCRAWVNFNGTGTVAIRASGNVSSITDNGTGDYTINFTNAMPDTDYVTVFGSAVSFNQTNGDQGWANLRSNNGGTNPQQTGSVRVWASSKNSALGSAVDIECINVAVFR